jgi:hypothetical protein
MSEPSAAATQLMNKVLELLEAEHGIAPLGIPDRPEDTRTAMLSLMGDKSFDRDFAREFASRLAEKVRAATGDAAYVLSDWEVAESDQADCDDLDGNRVSAFMADRRCYRIILTLVPAQP